MSDLTPDPYDDPSEWTDTECVLAGRELRRNRLNAVSMTYNRMLRGLKRLGWDNITPEQYKETERNPINQTAVIRAGLVRDATRVIRGDLPAYTNSDLYTQAAMRVIMGHREQQRLGYDELAEAITSMGEPITKDEYRTMEQGLAKHVPVSVVLRAVTALEIPWDIFFAVTHSTYQELSYAD